MIHFEKIYKFPISENDEKDKKVIVHFGLDEDLILNHPKDGDDLLFIFVHINESQWFKDRSNDNPNIMVVNLNVDEKNLSKEILERVVDKMMESQKVALQDYYIVQKKDDKS